MLNVYVILIYKYIVYAMFITWVNKARRFIIASVYGEDTITPQSFFLPVKVKLFNCLNCLR